MIIGLVLLQQGKGADAGAVFGSNSDAVLGPGTAPSFFTKLTTGLAIAFMFTSIFLVKSYLAQGNERSAAVSSQKPDVSNDTLFAAQPQKVEEKAEEKTAEQPAAVTAESDTANKQVQAPVAAETAQPKAETAPENTEQTK